MKRALGLGIIGCLLASASHATVCSVSAGNLSFGQIVQLDPTPADLQSSIAIACTADAADLGGVPARAVVNYQIQLSAGSSGNMLGRVMTRAGGIGVLPYNVFTDPGRTQVWGDGSNGTSAQTGELVFSATEILRGVSRNETHLTYARVPAGINALPGDYGDTLIVSLQF